MEEAALVPDALPPRVFAGLGCDAVGKRNLAANGVNVPARHAGKQLCFAFLAGANAGMVLRQVAARFAAPRVTNHVTALVILPV